MRDDYSLIPAGKSLLPKSLGFQAQSVRVDNMSNQWLQEETTLTWIPPYTIGRCFSVYGQQTAFILNTTPPGISQPTISFQAQYAVAMYTEAYLNESAGFPYIQTLSIDAPQRNGAYQGGMDNQTYDNRTPGQALILAYNPDIGTSRNGVVKAVYLSIQRRLPYTDKGFQGAQLSARIGVKPPSFGPLGFGGIVAQVTLHSNVVQDIVEGAWALDLPVLNQDHWASPGFDGPQDFFWVEWDNDETGGECYIRASATIFEYDT